jgi:tripartite-type tricarboxylate transporter receptor subunit TctC
MAPARVPAAIIAKLNTATQEVLRAPDAREQMSRQGLEPTGGSPADAAAHIKRETATWRRVIKEAGIKLQ